MKSFFLNDAIVQIFTNLTNNCEMLAIRRKVGFGISWEGREDILNRWLWEKVWYGKTGLNVARSSRYSYTRWTYKYDVSRVRNLYAVLEEDGEWKWKDESRWQYIKKVMLAGIWHLDKMILYLIRWYQKSWVCDGYFITTLIDFMEHLVMGEWERG